MWRGAPARRRSEAETDASIAAKRKGERRTAAKAAPPRQPPGRASLEGEQRGRMGGAMTAKLYWRMGAGAVTDGTTGDRRLSTDAKVGGETLVVVAKLGPKRAQQC